MRITFYALLVVVFCFVSCKEVDNTLLHGKWKATEWVKQGQVKDKTGDDTWFEFRPDGRYTYHTFTYEESGPYRTMANRLYTQDTINAKAIEKSVEIIKVTADSLFFKMNNRGIDEELRLIKVK